MGARGKKGGRGGERMSLLSVGCCQSGIWKRKCDGWSRLAQSDLENLPSPSEEVPWVTVDLRILQLFVGSPEVHASFAVGCLWNVCWCPSVASTPGWLDHFLSKIFHIFFYFIVVRYWECFQLMLLHFMSFCCAHVSFSVGCAIPGYIPGE